ncbi:MAG TPA: hypothetical protein PKE12_15225 [Kiritimatiellia bacterium]|nr:hypothetical protein [Kiritimatiellia bacterium]
MPHRIKRLRYILPATDNLREVRPSICWEHMYGWIDGYALLFDPVLWARTRTLPEWENGWNKKSVPGDFYITSCAQATAPFRDPTRPGLYVRPAGLPKIVQADRVSEKETLATPAGATPYPFGYLYDVYDGPTGRWMLGERPALRKTGRAVAVAFEFFAMVGSFRSEIPEETYLRGAAMLGELLAECGMERDAPARKVDRDLRLDFQAYGLNRFMLQWLLDLKGRSRSGVGPADASFLQAMSACLAGRHAEARRALGRAFERLAELRRALSPMDLVFLEHPHIGILFEDKGFFEFEWPQGTHDMLRSYIEQVETRGYKVHLEAGADCWMNLAKRYPQLVKKLAALWKQGRIELTNGTYSLPYALLSPLSLQYRQFQVGAATFASVFGKRPHVYQCQENSFTPQMPELLRHFGYRQALHIVQNRGAMPAETTPFITWTSPAGHGLRAMTTPHPALARKGANYFLDLPLVHHEFGAREPSMNYMNFQDIGYVPFRMHMIRAHRYAPVWGRFALDSERMAEAADAPAPVRTYFADDYQLSEKYFYPSESNVDPFSHMERIYTLSGRLRQLRAAGAKHPQRKRLFDILDRCSDTLCLLEAHDCIYCMGFRRGEFYANNAYQVSPYSRETLTDKVASMVGDAEAALKQAAALIQPRTPARTLFNASEVPLAFARVRDEASHALGPFPAFSARTPANRAATARACKLPLDHGRWRVAVDRNGPLCLTYKGQTIRGRPIDRKLGPFTHVATRAERRGGLLFVTLQYQRRDREIQTVDLELVLAETGDHAEINVTYAPRTDFGMLRKWGDFLALEWTLDTALSRVWRFNPNVRSETKEDRTASSYYLGVETSAGTQVSLMNEGAMLYELERERGVVRWLFHVQHEHTHTRRMGVAFDRSEAFQLARAWSQGVFAANPELPRVLTECDWRGVSVEDWVAPGALLVSNLGNEARTLRIPTRAVRGASNLVGKSIVKSGQLTLKPMELALVRI